MITIYSIHNKVQDGIDIESTRLANRLRIDYDSRLRLATTRLRDSRLATRDYDSRLRLATRPSVRRHHCRQIESESSLQVHYSKRTIDRHQTSDTSAYPTVRPRRRPRPSPTPSPPSWEADDQTPSLSIVCILPTAAVQQE